MADVDYANRLLLVDSFYDDPKRRKDRKKIRLSMTDDRRERRLNENDKNTCREEPRTSKASHLVTCSETKSTMARLTLSPKKVTSGFTIPPHLWHMGTLKVVTSWSLMSTSPSGAIRSPSTAQFRLSWSISVCSSDRLIIAEQSRHFTRYNEPCSSVTQLAPALVCRWSTFWVTSHWSLLSFSHPARIWWLRLGRKLENCGQPA